jgi:hypothetical protein
MVATPGSPHGFLVGEGDAARGHLFGRVELVSRDDDVEYHHRLRMK